MWGKIGYGLLGLLVLACLGLMFLLNVVLGIVFAVFTAGVLAWVYGVRKRKVDNLIVGAAAEVGLTVEKKILRHPGMSGEFGGRAVRLSYEGAPSGSSGSILGLAADMPGLSALDAGNMTVIRMAHGREVDRGRVIEDGPPLVAIRPGEAVLAAPGLITDGPQLIRLLKRLAEAVEAIERGD